MSEKALTTSPVWSLGMVVRRVDSGEGQLSRSGLWWVRDTRAKCSPASVWFYEARNPIHNSLCSILLGQKLAELRPPLGTRSINLVGARPSLPQPVCSQQTTSSFWTQQHTTFNSYLGKCPFSLQAGRPSGVKKTLMVNDLMDRGQDQ